MTRVTRATVGQRVDRINRLNETLGVSKKIVTQSRNGYLALDLYEGGTCLRTLTCGTARECYLWLDGLEAALSLKEAS
jgi:hypothetical protein